MEYVVSPEELPPAPGKFAATVKVGEKGQIVIPKGARDLFGIRPGDTLLLLADVEQGIAIVRQDVFDRFVEQAMPPAAGAPPASKEEDTGRGGGRS
ncbi:AbrB/MazE/SpoVT family DNA-binding domain-containing protein [Streptosporangium sp. NPDC023615]|uniref:AbrB/MazE/SpoVT family DNA-binding domain-containing protein n=1 Tax=Streptosporangium sp. NPDC023615 TaxID=3154794 RepID=UPI003418501F